MKEQEDKKLRTLLGGFEVEFYDGVYSLSDKIVQALDPQNPDLKERIFKHIHGLEDEDQFVSFLTDTMDASFEIGFVLGNMSDEVRDPDLLERFNEVKRMIEEEGILKLFPREKKAA